MKERSKHIILLLVVLAMAFVIVGCDSNTPAPGAAKIGDTSYATFEEAVEAAESGDTVVLSSDVTLNTDATLISGVILEIPSGKKLTVPAGKTLTLEDGAGLTNDGTVDVSGNIAVTDTDLVTGDGTYEFALGSALQYVISGTTTDYVSSADTAIIKVTGDVSITINAQDGPSFTIKEGVATVQFPNGSSIYHQTADQEIVVESGATLEVAINFANHGTITVKNGGTLQVDTDIDIYASNTNSTGKIRLETGSTLTGEGTIGGSYLSNYTAGHLYSWNGGSWVPTSL